MQVSETERREEEEGKEGGESSKASNPEKWKFELPSVKFDCSSLSTRCPSHAAILPARRQKGARARDIFLWIPNLTGVRGI